MNEIEIYTKDWCIYCLMAKQLLGKKGLPFKEIDVAANAAKEWEMIERSGQHTVPQIFINGTHVGGCRELQNAEASGDLDSMLDQDSSDPS